MDASGNHAPIPRQRWVGEAFMPPTQKTTQAQVRQSLSEKKMGV